MIMFELIVAVIKATKRNLRIGRILILSYYKSSITAN